MSLTIHIRLAAVVAGLGLLGYFLWGLYVRGGRKWDRRTITRALPMILIPLGIAASIFVWINYIKWGQAWPKFNSAGFGTPLYVGILGNLFSPGASIFLYSPLLLLIPWAMKNFWKKHRAETTLILGISLISLLVFSKYGAWHGMWSCVGPRYLFISVVLLMLPLGLWIDESRDKLKWFWIRLLSVMGLIIQFLLMTINWAYTYHELGYPEYQPEYSFLFIPDHSPIVNYIRFFFKGHNIDPWTWKLWYGWTGQSPQPSTALIVFIVWGVLFIITVWSLWRNYKQRSTQA